MCVRIYIYIYMCVCVCVVACVQVLLNVMDNECVISFFHSAFDLSLQQNIYKEHV